MTNAMIANGVFTRMRSEVVCIAPALTTDTATLDELVAGVRNAITTVFGE
jgi:adenosylmethionine-8-amino-7-oxononanoate aminotransferase